MEKKVYKSKFGWKVIGFLIALFAIVFWISSAEENSNNSELTLLLVFGGVLVFFALTSLNTRYTIKKTDVIIRCLPFYNKTIAIDTIRKVEVSRNLISSPAPSLDRIEIYFGKYDSVVISPRNKIQFMQDLQERNSAIQLKTKF